MHLRKQDQFIVKRLKGLSVVIAASAMAGLMSCTAFAESGVVAVGEHVSNYGPGYVQSAEGWREVQDEGGWRYLDGSWYFYHLSDGDGLVMQAGGWLWVDGYCYYFYEDGRMAAACVTPDGYHVSDSGAWTEAGIAVFMPGKGIMTQTTAQSSGWTGEGGGSGGGSGGSGGGNGGSGGGSGGLGGGSGSSGGGNVVTGEESGSAGNPGIGTEDMGEATGGAGDSGDTSGDLNGGESQENDLQERLEYWQNRAREADFAITGIDNPLDKSYMVQDKDANDRRMKNLVSMISDWEPHEFYMIGVNYQADTLILGQAFREQVIYSNTVEDSFHISGVSYTISRIGIRKIQKNIQENIEAETTPDEAEEEENIPSVGRHYSYGDVVRRKIGGQSYRFRCIDEDYRDASGNYRGVALFLCDVVIRSDIDGHSSDGSLLKFGSDNNYKKSDVRRWLNRNTSENAFSESKVNVGVRNAYEGTTEPDCWEQIDAGDLRSYPLKQQKLNDGIFLLSVEEAIEYAEELWRFDGSEENNPEDQYSPWSKGYYLRTPQYEEDESGEFCYGKGIYMVDLMEGNIHVADVSYTTIGLRPAFVLANG